MTEHKFTDDEIIRALECCFINSNCNGCPQVGREKCLNNAGCDAVDLINRQKAEIERLKAPRFMVTPSPIAEDNLTPLAKLQKIVIYDEPSVSIKRIDEEGIRAEAIKEFAERLKERGYTNNYCQDIVLVESIDNLVKEMTEGES